MKKVAFHTLGCKLNFSETSEIGRQLEEAGFERVSFGTPADVTVIHTCSVTGSADRKTRQAIHKAVHTSPEGFIVAMGCLAQLKPEELASWHGVDLVLGTSDKFDLVKYLGDIRKKPVAEIHSCEIAEENKFFSAHSTSERTRAFLKVQDGCDYPCSYCTIPKARGKSRSPFITIITEQAKELANKGLHEIVLTGVNIGDFGKTTGESFLDLVKKLDDTDGILRFRISSIEPNLIPDDLVRFVADSKRFAPHFHIPLQSGSDKILRLMRRRYLRKTFAERVEKIKELMPDAAVGADVIVGFPGETQEDFEDACRFIQSLPLSYLHVFTYSERAGTVAATMGGKIPERIRDERSHILHEIGNELKMNFYRSLAGQERIVIFEQKRKDGTVTGYTDNYAEVVIPWQEDVVHQIKRVRLGGLSGDLMTAALL
ncbi:MAG: tRNA (N(6)-L-threonylcarbamoyladenosine(37)-C(2))-methylthiotransferase MtaB [Bacteroidetes bacterium GWF2_49_14]|nr:MAG: tRNA (N(6)-L-threonylcarbamoyladenosine(37)-C(2))-methylthiotransferase MtaB [Bacteroidetes bacterium GWF2_49_14]HBB90944.1 tRNA (N(6)-L-threonylcarbamoyladenosine(37)-C(2))-methylthiotransferase MtaB [Bacteroidales bacterium]